MKINFFINDQIRVIMKLWLIKYKEHSFSETSLWHMCMHAHVRHSKSRMAWECFLQPLLLLMVTSEMVFISYVDSERLVSGPVSLSSSPSLTLSRPPLFHFSHHSLRPLSLQSGLGFSIYWHESTCRGLLCDYCSLLMMMHNNIYSPNWKPQRNQTC